MRVLLCGILLLFHQVTLAQANLAQATGETQEVQAWRDFARRVEAAGVEILKTYPQPDALDKAEGLRYLLQQLGSSIQAGLVEEPGQIPLLRVGATTINKWGLDGADAKYQGAAINGDSAYRLHGQLGSARLFALQLTRMQGEYAAFGALTGDQLQADDSGKFEVLISPAKPADWQGVWLRLEPATDSFLVREYFSDWQSERPGRYYLEEIGNAQNSEPATSERVAALLNDTAANFSTRAPQWQERVQQARSHLVNKVYMQKADGQGLASNIYGSGWFDVGSDQALVIEMDAPDALLWSVQLGNVWWESIDYINHTASYNDSQAVASSDGRYRFVLSHQDPRVPNWLDPAGHSEGAIMFRLQEAKASVNPVLTLVPFAELAGYLPPDTPQVGVDHRDRELSQRRAHAAVRWAP